MSRNIGAPEWKTLEDVLVVFRRNYVKPESEAKQNCFKLTFYPSIKSVPNFIEELNEYDERVFGDNAQHMKDSPTFFAAFFFRVETTFDSKVHLHL